MKQEREIKKLRKEKARVEWLIRCCPSSRRTRLNKLFSRRDDLFNRLRNKSQEFKREMFRQNSREHHLRVIDSILEDK